MIKGISETALPKRRRDWFPLHPSNRSPEQIVGSHMPLLEMHYKESLKESDPVAWEKRMAKFSESDREVCRRLYEELREVGIWPCGIDRYGSIEWGIAVRSDLMRYVNSLPFPTKDNRFYRGDDDE